MDIESFRALLAPAGQRLLTEVEAYDPGIDPVTLTTRLRRDHPAPLVAAALTQARLRARAASKLGPDAARMYFTEAGLEQATRASVAAHRAHRYARAGRVVDLCCGVGGDLVALARAGPRVDGVDGDPLTVEVARANIEALGLSDRVSLRCAGAGSVDPAPYDAAFCDPARRRPAGTHGRPRAGDAHREWTRIFDPAAYSPPWGCVLALVRRPPGGCAKVAPGIPHGILPEDAEAEWVSDAGEVKEAALWFGTLSSGARRRATLLPSGATLVPDDSLGPPPVAPPRRYLYEPDGAVIRAGLVAEVAGAVDGALLDPTIAYVTSDRRVPTPYARSYEVTDVLRFSLKRLRALLRSRGVGRVTIKKRGSAVDVERLRKDLRLAGDASAVVVLTRVAGAPTVVVCQPVGG